MGGSSEGHAGVKTESRPRFSTQMTFGSPSFRDRAIYLKSIANLFTDDWPVFSPNLVVRTTQLR